MYPDPADIKKHRFNLSVNDEQKCLFAEEAQACRMQVTPTILELALEGLKWRRMHASHSANQSPALRRANA
ncbi:hypothetical protein [Acidovorax sp. FG27]|uniref:hypothetical protein n=1 Tax=Acidovorax sp. FG27 TaxID=3133652 RepID=UPI0030E80C4F